MIGYELEWVGLEEQIAKLDDYEDLSGRELYDATDRSVRFIKNRAVANAPRLMGDLASSGFAEVNKIAGEFEGRVGFTDFVALWIEYGTEPHWPPSQQIAQLMGVDPVQAHFIVESIGRQGTKGRFFLWKAANRAVSFVNRQFEEALEQLANRLSV